MNYMQAYNMNHRCAMAVIYSPQGEYRAFAQSLRDMAALEATMQAVAESGQQVLQRLSAGTRPASH